MNQKLLDSIFIKNKEYKYKRFIINNNDNSFTEYAVIENLYIDNNSNATIQYHDPVYNCESPDQYYHLLQHNISTYEYLKKICIPNLQLVCFGPIGTNQLNVFNNIIELYNLKKNFHYFINGNTPNLLIKNFIFIPPDSNGLGNEFASDVLDRKLFEKIYKESLHGLNIEHMFDSKGKILKELFMTYCIEDNSFPQKIFISRNIVTWSKYKNLEIDMSSHRFIEFNTQLEIENIFYNKGYSIINLENMQLKHQIKYFYNAKKIAGISGTNLYNALFAKPNTVLIDIDPLKHNKYTFSWQKVLQCANLNYINYKYIDAESLNSWEVL